MVYLIMGIFSCHSVAGFAQTAPYIFSRSVSESGDKMQILHHFQRTEIQTGDVSKIVTVPLPYLNIIISAGGEKIALFLTDKEGNPTAVRIIDGEGKIILDLEFVMRADRAVFNPNSTQIAIIVGEKDPDEGDPGFTSYGLLILDLTDLTTSWIIQDIKIEERPVNWYRTSARNYNWWMRDVRWIDDSTLLLLSFAGVRTIHARSGEVLTATELGWDCGMEIPRPILSPSGRYLMFGPCLRSTSSEYEMFFDLQSQTVVSGFSSDVIEDGLNLDDWKIRYRWVNGNDPVDILALELTHKPILNRAARTRTPSPEPVRLKLIDATNRTVIADATNSRFTLDGGDVYWMIPRYSSVMFKNGNVSPFHVDSL